MGLHVEKKSDVFTIFKQKTAYEMTDCDWSSDVCSSDLVWGPSPTTSYGGSSYFVSFIDDFSRKVWVYILKKKSDVFTVFKQFRALVENITGRTIKCLRTDNGGEFTSIEFEQYCKDEGIIRQKKLLFILLSKIMLLSV